MPYTSSPGWNRVTPGSMSSTTPLMSQPRMNGGLPSSGNCPDRIIAAKWAVVVLYGLADKPRRHGDLARLIGGISNKVLTHTLRRLESSGLVARHVYAAAPPRVEYELTELGRTLIDPIRMLAQWAEANGDAILDAQERA